MIIEWKKILSIEHLGHLYKTPGSQKLFHIVCKDYIYFYELQKTSDDQYEVVKQKSIFNFMECSGFVIGSKELRSFSFRQGEQDITANRRKYFHSLMGTIEKGNYSNSKGIDFADKNCFVILKDDNLNIYCSICNQFLQKLTINFIPYDDNIFEYNVEVLSMQISANKKYLALLTGVVMVKEREMVMQLIVYKITKSPNERFRLIFDYFLPQ